MAKNVGYDPTDYAGQQEKIRKAKGNPNKNVHAKKNGSNYRGAMAVEQKKKSEAASDGKRRPLVDVPKPVKTVLLVLAAVIILLLILWQAVFKDSQLLFYAISFLVGVACCIYAYFSYQAARDQKARNTVHMVVLVIVGVLGVVYLFVGARGVLTLLGV